MATPLDFGLLKQFEVIFPFIFTLAITFAIFTQWVPVLKDNKTLAGIAAFSIAVMMMFSPIAVRSLTLAAPWFVIFTMFIILTLMGFYTMGIKESTVVSVVQSERWQFISIIIAVVFIGIAVGSVSKAVSEQGGFGPDVQQSQEAEFYNTIFNSKVLGMVFIMFIAFFTIMILGRRSSWD